MSGLFAAECPVRRNLVKGSKFFSPNHWFRWGVRGGPGSENRIGSWVGLPGVTHGRFNIGCGGKGFWGW